MIFGISTNAKYHHTATHKQKFNQISVASDTFGTTYARKAKKLKHEIKTTQLQMSDKIEITPYIFLQMGLFHVTKRKYNED